VTQTRGSARLPEEPLQQLILSKRLSQDLDGNAAIEIGIAPQVHGAHTAVAEAAHDLVPGDLQWR
jgi:hypothetical protein